LMQGVPLISTILYTPPSAGCLWQVTTIKSTQTCYNDSKSNK
jgi:hypothetical protein